MTYTAHHRASPHITAHRRTSPRIAAHQVMTAPILHFPNHYDRAMARGRIAAQAVRERGGSELDAALAQIRTTFDDELRADTMAAFKLSSAMARGRIPTMEEVAEMMAPMMAKKGRTTMTEYYIVREGRYEQHQLTGSWQATSPGKAIAQMLQESGEEDDGTWAAFPVMSPNDVIR
jgi:hypothetical protein